MRKQLIISGLLILFIFSSSAAARVYHVENTKFFNDDKIGLYIIKGELNFKEGKDLDLGAFFRTYDKGNLKTLMLFPEYNERKVSRISLYGEVRNKNSIETEFSLKSFNSEKDIKIKWLYSMVPEGDKTITAEFIKKKIQFVWSSMERGNGKNATSYWIDAGANYCRNILKEDYFYYYNNKRSSSRNRARRQKTTSVMNLFGGRAAVEETLQLDPLFTENKKHKTDGIKIPVDKIKGVETQPYPFKDKKIKKQESLSLADYCPKDRFLFYVLKPKSFLDLMENKREALYSSLSFYMPRNADYRLYEKYTKKLGLKKEDIEKLVNSGAVEEFMILLPDLFLAEGSDITIAAKLKTLNFTSALFKLSKFSLKSQIKEIETDEGKKFYRVIKNGVLFISTSKKEIKNSISIAENKRDSLGDSSEFRYMTSRLKPEKDTSYFAYFSDQFIRRLVSPEVKISQLRRLKAKAELEAFTSAYLLYKADGNKDNPDPQKLIDIGYAPKPEYLKGIKFAENGLCVSKNYNSLKDLKTLGEKEVKFATAEEADAYNEFFKNYNKYWAEYFDPIAIRINQKDSKEFKVSAFILPLIENSVYEGLKNLIGSSDQKLKIPELSPKPVSIFSLNLGKETRKRAIKLFQNVLPYQLYSTLLEFAGPGFHIAFTDTDPLIQLGTGKLSGTGGKLDSRLLRGNMAVIPVLFSALTRPVHILIEIEDEKEIKTYLGKIYKSFYEDEKWLGVIESNLSKINEKDFFIFNISAAGFLNIDLKVKIENGYLVISNMPYTNKIDVKGHKTPELSGASFKIYPSFVKKQLPSIFASGLKIQKESAFFGAGGVYPLYQIGLRDKEKIADRHYELFGYSPFHPGNGKWIPDDGFIKSSEFSYPYTETIPMYNKNKDLKLFRNIEIIKLNTEIIDNNLRADFIWRLN